MKNPFPYSDSNKRYHTYTCFLSRRFGGKVSRVPLNAGFTCPNLDGTKGRGGCVYCSPAGSGEFGGNPRLPIREQFSQVAARMAGKWDTPRHIAYFQARTNTYAPADTLRINIVNGSAPCIITPEDGGDSFLYMILPVRLRSEG